MDKKHWTHTLIYPVSKRAYCRYWSARIFWRCFTSAKSEYGGVFRFVPSWPVFLFELLRPNQSVKIKITESGW